jgi:hypothetical protein
MKRKGKGLDGLFVQFVQVRLIGIALAETLLLFLTTSLEMTTNSLNPLK